MADIIKGLNWANIGTGVGTAVLSDRPTTFVRIVVPGTYIGTMIFHDASSTGGTTVTSAIGTFGIPNTNVAGNIEIWADCTKGLLYQSTGTPSMVALWD